MLKDAKRAQFEGGTLETIINPADKCRIIYNLLSNLKLNDTPLTVKAFNATNLDETFLSFLKGKETVEDLILLNSKARHQREDKLLKEALKHWFVPTELVREYYGDEVAMYFSWMNFLISKYNTCHIICRVAAGSGGPCPPHPPRELLHLARCFPFPTKLPLLNLLCSLGLALYHILEAPLSRPSDRMGQPSVTAS